MEYEDAIKYIDTWDKPLNKHTRTRYEECFAKYVLERFLPKQYHTLELGDRPDLFNVALDIGVEVSSAVNENQINAISLSTDIVYGRVRDKQKAIERIKKLGSTFTEYGTSHHQPDTSYEDLIVTYREKTERLNSQDWKVFANNHLFVEINSLFLEYSFDKLMREITDINNSFKIHFNMVILWFCNFLFVLDIDNNSIEKREYSINEFTVCAVEARLLVEDREPK